MLRIADLKSLCMSNIDTSQLSKRATVKAERYRLQSPFIKAFTVLRSAEELTAWFEHQNENLIASLTKLAAAPRQFDIKLIRYRKFHRKNFQP